MRLRRACPDGCHDGCRALLTLFSCPYIPNPLASAPLHIPSSPPPSRSAAALQRSSSRSSVLRKVDLISVSLQRAAAAQEAKERQQQPLQVRAPASSAHLRHAAPFPTPFPSQGSLPAS